MKFIDPLDKLLFCLFHGILMASPLIVLLALILE